MGFHIISAVGASVTLRMWKVNPRGNQNQTEHTQAEDSGYSYRRFSSELNASRKVLLAYAVETKSNTVLCTKTVESALFHILWIV